MTEKEKVLRKQRERMGLCTNCGGMKSNPHWKQCEKCREKERNRLREKLIASYTIELHPNKPPKPKEINSKHKCWNCEWGTFLGDRFFCPFVEGTCAKDETTFKVENKRKMEGKHED